MDLHDRLKGLILGYPDFSITRMHLGLLYFEILYVGSLGGHMYPKGILLKLLVWLPRKCFIEYFTFLPSFCTYHHSKHHNLGIFIILKNGLYHFKAHRISFQLVYIKT